MREKANESVKTKIGGMGGQMSRMGKIKSFGELQDGMTKLRENFDIMIGKPQGLPVSPLKAKDLKSEIEGKLTGRGSMKEQECETDEEDNEIRLRTNSIL